MKIYIVKASSGKWDGYHQWIHSAHLDRSKAELECLRINFEWRDKLSTLPPFPVDEDGCLINEESYSNEDQRKYYAWWHMMGDAKEWNGAKVEEYETDKVYPRQVYVK